MPKVERTEIFDSPIEKIYDVIVDFASYPQFVPGVDKIIVLDGSKDQTRAEYQINIIKNFKYIIKIKHQKPTTVSWTFESGDLFKKNDGGWSLKKIDENKTEVTYYLDVEFKIFAPKMIVDKLVAGNLPQMMQSFAKRVKSR